MQAVRIHPNPSKPWGLDNPAPSSALHLDSNIPIPRPSKPGDVLVRVKATTLVRDTLTWPEMLAYLHLETISPAWLKQSQTRKLRA